MLGKVHKRMADTSHALQAMRPQQNAVKACSSDQGISAAIHKCQLPSNETCTIQHADVSVRAVRFSKQPWHSSSLPYIVLQDSFDSCS
jgi:hypothetical protein